jgi:hypothetical protein
MDGAPDIHSPHTIASLGHILCLSGRMGNGSSRSFPASTQLTKVGEEGRDEGVEGGDVPFLHTQLMLRADPVKDGLGCYR